MGLTKRKDSYYVEFRVIDDGRFLTLPSNTYEGRLKRWKVGSLNRTQAKQQEVLLKTELMKGLIRSDRNIPVTFNQWADAYLKLEDVRALATYQDRYESIHRQLKPYFRSKPLGDLTIADVEGFRRSRTLKNGKAPAVATVNADHACLKHMLSLAEKRGLVPTNVAKKVPLPDPRNERDRVLSDEEWEALYQLAASHLKPVLLLAYHLGPRLSEILELTWDRVDLRRGLMNLRAEDTKIRERRTIPLTPAVWEMLRGLAEVRSLVCPFVFQYDGKAIQRVKRSFRTAVRKAGIKNFKFHDLRHCAATNLRRAGIDTVTAMKIVGHKSEKMHRRYNCVSESDLTQAANKLHSYLSNTLITPTTNLPVGSSSIPA
jgi:integrase